MTASEDRLLLITADSGPNSLLVVWDSVTGHPTKTVQQPHVNGISTMALSPDGLQLVTISAAADGSTEQEVNVWLGVLCQHKACMRVVQL